METLQNGAGAAMPEELPCTLTPKTFRRLKQGKILYGINSHMFTLLRLSPLRFKESSHRFHLLMWEGQGYSRASRMGNIFATICEKYYLPHLDFTESMQHIYLTEFCQCLVLKLEIYSFIQSNMF